MNNTSYTPMLQASCLKVGECSETKPALERPDGVHLNKQASDYRSVRLIVQTEKHMLPKEQKGRHDWFLLYLHDAFIVVSMRMEVR
jgi:hypothetical protein